MKYLPVALVGLLTMTGCELTPFVKTGVAVQINKPDMTLCKHEICQETTDSLAKLELGLQGQVGGLIISGSYHHSSEVNRGWPRNDLAENYSDELWLMFTYKFKSFKIFD